MPSKGRYASRGSWRLTLPMICRASPARGTPNLRAKIGCRQPGQPWHPSPVTHHTLSLSEEEMTTERQNLSGRPCCVCTTRPRRVFIRKLARHAQTQLRVASNTHPTSHINACVTDKATPHDQARAYTCTLTQTVDTATHPSKQQKHALRVYELNKSNTQLDSKIFHRI